MMNDFSPSPSGELHETSPETQHIGFWIPRRVATDEPIIQENCVPHPDIAHPETAIPRQRQLWKESRLIACW